MKVAVTEDFTGVGRETAHPRGQLQEVVREFAALNVFITEQERLKINELNIQHKEGKQNDKVNPREAGARSTDKGGLMNWKGGKWGNSKVNPSAGSSK